MVQKHIIIIGAGIAGLCAGSYLQMNGYSTEIFEAHSIPGGLCTSWKRGEYLFDGCIHSMAGANPNSQMGKQWQELIDLNQIKFQFWEELAQVELTTGEIIHISSNPDILEQELLQIAPQDSSFIKKLIHAIKAMMKHETGIKKPLELWNPLDYYLNQFRTAPYIQYLIQWRQSLEEITKMCHSQILKEILCNGFFSHYPAYFFVISMGELYQKKAGYPIGGSLAFAKLLEKKYLQEGGKIHYNSPVKKINVVNNHAVGITLQNDEEHNTADIVISAADGYKTAFELLAGKFVNEKIQKLYTEHPVHPSAILVSLGIARSFDGEPAIIELFLKTPWIIDDKTTLTKIPITIYNFDPTLAPKGKTCIRVIIDTNNFQYWQNLKETNKIRYVQEKNQIAQTIIDLLEQRFGQVKGNVEQIDIATPATFYRYTNSWKGSCQGWEWLPGLIPESFKKELPGLKNFYQIGQWVMAGGGIPAGLTTGRDIAQIVCHKDHKKFKTG